VSDFGSSAGNSKGHFVIGSGLLPGALGGTRTPNLLIRRFRCGRQTPFRPVRELGLVSPGCPGGSGSSEDCSSAWSQRGSQSHAARTGLMIFKGIRDSPFIAALAWTFSMSTCYVTQDHPAYIQRGQRWPFRPGLAAPLEVWAVVPANSVCCRASSLVAVRRALE